MRPALSWSDLPGRRVGVYGLGREGAASARACRALGIDPVLVDDAPGRVDDTQPGIRGFPVLRTADDGFEALTQCDVVIAGPGISRYGPVIEALRRKEIHLAGGLGLWLAGAELAKVICVTGTKGKSTTTAIIAHLAQGLGMHAQIGGNIGVPPFDPLLGGDEPDLWVIEVSSYQAVSVQVAPPQIGVTSLHPDHLPWHGNDPERYYRDKLSICRLPGARFTVANGDSPLLRDRESLLGPQVRWIHAAAAAGAAWIEGLGLLGVHNRRNALIAQALLVAAGVTGAGDESALAAAAGGFQGLESRLQHIATVDGVRFIDDGLSTNVLPTLAALDAFEDQRVALIVGGQDRGIDYQPLARGLRHRRTELLVIAVPDNGARIRAELLATDPGPAVTVEQADDLAQAVTIGYRWARPDGVVLLSPAAPSFGRFTDYRHRGADFAAAAASCAPPAGQ